MPALKKPRRIKFHRLKRPKIRSDMKKENLYNLSRLKPPVTADRTYFQQKWTAKSLTRAYHGQHVREGQWTRMFSRRPPAVVPMNPTYLATHDGSDEASGRGSGRQTLPAWVEDERVSDAIREREPTAKEEALTAGRRWEGPDGERDAWLKKVKSETVKKIQMQYGFNKEAEATPYMQMVYHPLERRLDMALWRALFASSAKQARQFVCHGGVRVNGQTMRFPGYLLNPGDMFQVEPERAMWGLGENMGPIGRMTQIMKTDMNLLRNPPPPSPYRPASRGMSTRATAAHATEEAFDDDEVEDAANEDEYNQLDEQEHDDAALKARKRKLRDLISQARETLVRNKTKKSINNKTKQNLREFIRELRSSQSRIRGLEDTVIINLESRFTDLSNSIKRAQPAPQRNNAQESAVEREDEEARESEKIKALRAGPRWNPREYLSPFAFIPRYLEVNHAICSAVYLRHPVCGPGFAEVPTPYGVETGGLAFNWYLRRR